MFKFLAVVATLLVFAKQSQGSVSSAIQESIAFELTVTDPIQQFVDETALLKGSENLSLLANETIEAVRKTVQQYPIYVSFPTEVYNSMHGINAGVKLTSGLGNAGYEALDTAWNLMKEQNTQGAISALNNAFEYDRDSIYIASLASLAPQGNNVARFGGAAVPGLKESVISIEDAIKTAFQTLEQSKKLAIEGIETGDILLAGVALEGARETITKGGEKSYEKYLNAATQTLDAITGAAAKVSFYDDSFNPIAEAKESLKTQVSTDDAAALNAIVRLNNGFSNAPTKASSVDAATIYNVGLTSAISETANAFSVLKKALEEAKLIVAQDASAAADVILKGLEEAEKVLLNGWADATLALGCALEIIGEKAPEGILSATVQIGNARFLGLQQLELASKAAISGIQGHEIASEQGIDSGLQLLSGSGSQSYEKYVQAGVYGFQVIQAA